MNSRILIVLLGSIGDVTRGLAVANALKSHGNFDVSWVVEPKSAAIVRMCPDVDRVFVFQRNGGVGEFCRTVRELRSQNFDVVLDLQRHAKSGLFSLLSGAKRRIGFHRKNTKEFNHLFNNEQIPPWNISPENNRRSKLDAYLSFLPLLEVPIPHKPTWCLDESRSSEAILSENQHADASALPAQNTKCIGLVLASSWRSKDWMGNEALCRAILNERNDTVILVGDGKSVELANRLVALNPSRIVSTAGAVSLAGLVSILRRCRVVVGPDSGPGHICAALSVPFVGIFGPTDPSITAPAGNTHLALTAELGCAPCYRRVCPGLGKLCLRLISPHQVMERISEALQE